MPNISFKGLCCLEAKDELYRMLPDFLHDKLEAMSGFDLLAQTVGYYCTCEYTSIKAVHQEMLKEWPYSSTDSMRTVIQQFIERFYEIQMCYKEDNCPTYFLEHYSEFLDKKGAHYSVSALVKAMAKTVLDKISKEGQG